MQYFLKTLNKKILSSILLQLSSILNLARLYFFIFISLLILLLASCNDYGCIDPDDFGGYQVQKLYIKASGQSGCYYDRLSKDPFSINASHGSNFRKCITEQKVEFFYFDTSGNEIREVNDCSSVASDNKKVNSCLERCASICSSLYPSSSNDWVYNSNLRGDSGVKISPNTEILVTAKGSISLTESINYSQFKLLPKLFIPSSKDSYLNDKALNFNSGQSVKFEYGGEVKIGFNQSNNTSNNTYSTIAKTNSTITASEVINFANHIGVMAIEFPVGHSFDSARNSDFVGSVGVPIAPDPNSWRCDYSDPKSPKCTSDYYAAGYINIDNQKAGMVFPVNLIAPNDNLMTLNVKKGADICSTDKSRCYIGKISGNASKILSDVDFSSIVNNVSYAIYSKAYNSTSTNTNQLCDISVKVYLKKQDGTRGNDIHSSKILSNNLFTIMPDSFFAKDKNLEIEITNNQEMECNVSIDLEEAYYDYVAEKSGYVQMAYLSGSDYKQSCKVFGRIINPSYDNGSYYFEYSNVEDPLYKNNVGLDIFSAKNAPNIGNSEDNPWNKQLFYIRKGQIMRFYPKSWSDESVEKTRQNGISKISCGKGLAINIIERPALLCFGSAATKSRKLFNKDCKSIDYDASGNIVGCKANISDLRITNNNCKSCYETQLFNKNGNPYYCSINIANEAGCPDLGSNQGCKIDFFAQDNKMCSRAQNCSFDIIGYNSTENADCVKDVNCTSCKNVIIAEYKKPVFTVANGISQCYDFENYTSSINDFKTNILPYLDGTTKGERESSFLKGARRVKSFDGSVNYGVIDNYDTNKDIIPSSVNILNSNLKYFTSSQNTTILKNSRIKFFALNDSGSFLDYDNSLNSGDADIKITSENSKFKNGQWLEVNMCQNYFNKNTDSASCNTILPNNKMVVGYSNSDYNSGILSLNPDNFLVGNYKFNEAGDMIRMNPTLDPKFDCLYSNNGLYTSLDSNFFCHNVQDSQNNPVYFGFKIKDAEVGDCYISQNVDNCDPSKSLDIALKYNSCNEEKTYYKFCPLYGQDENSQDNECKKSSPLNTTSANPVVNSALIDIYDDYVSDIKNRKVLAGNYINIIEFAKSVCRKKYNPTKLTSYRCVSGTNAIDNCCEDSKYYSKYCNIPQFCDNKSCNILFPSFNNTDPYTNEKISIKTVNNQCYFFNERQIETYKALNNEDDTNIINSAKSLCKEDVKNSCLSGIEKDGVKVANPNFKGNNLSNFNAICSADEVKNNSCEKQFYCHDKYRNNSGEYEVTIKVKPDITNGSTAFIKSYLIQGIINPVVDFMDGEVEKNIDGSVKRDANGSPVIKTTGQSERIYKEIISDGRFQLIVKTCLVVFVMFYGLGYLIGISEFSHAELMSRVIKIGLIYLFIGVNGWHWFDKFFVQFFKNGIDQISFMMASSFDGSSYIANAIKANEFYDKAILFRSADKVFALFFNEVTQKKIAALLFENFFGFAYMLIIYHSFFVYFMAIINAVLLYTVAIVFVSLLFAVAPMFFIFLFFNKTKEFFDNWIKNLISFSLQQIMIMMTVGFFSALIYEFIKLSLNYGVCWDTVWRLDILRMDLMSFWTIQDSPPRYRIVNNAGYESASSMPSLFSIISIWAIATIAKNLINFMSDMGASIAGASSTSPKASQLAGDITKLVKGSFNEAIKSKRQDFNKYLKEKDDKIFNKGDYRKKKEDSRNEMKDKQSILASAAQDAIKDYKENNKAEFSKMDNKQKTEKLQEVSNDAIKEKANEMGMSEKDIRKLSRMDSKTTIEGLKDAYKSFRKNIALELQRDKNFISAKGDKSKGQKNNDARLAAEGSYLDKKTEQSNDKIGAKSSFENKLAAMTKDHSMPKSKDKKTKQSNDKIGAKSSSENKPAATTKGHLIPKSKKKK